MVEIASSAATGVLHLIIATLIVGPFAWWSARRHGAAFLDAQALRALILVAGLYVAASVILDLPRLGFFGELTFNWQNKLLLFVLLLLFVRLMPGIAWAEVGVRLPKRGWWVPVLYLLVFAAAVQALVGPLVEMPGDAEALAFQAMVPGLDEELLFRGVLLLFLDRALHRSAPGKQQGEQRIHWAAAFNCLLFGIAHGLMVTDDFDLIFDPGYILVTTLLGSFLIWVRIRWDSLLPAVLAHNALNSSIVVASMLSA